MILKRITSFIDTIKITEGLLFSEVGFTTGGWATSQVVRVQTSLFISSKLAFHVQIILLSYELEALKVHSTREIGT